MATNAEVEFDLQERLAELEQELRRADRQGAAHIKLMFRTAEIKIALDRVLERIAILGCGYAVTQLTADLEAIRAIARILGE